MLLMQRSTLIDASRLLIATVISRFLLMKRSKHLIAFSAIYRDLLFLVWIPHEILSSMLLSFELTSSKRSKTCIVNLLAYTHTHTHTQTHTHIERERERERHTHTHTHTRSHGSSRNS